jgi:hypothetical protein
LFSGPLSAAGQQAQKQKQQRPGDKPVVSAVFTQGMTIRTLELPVTPLRGAAGGITGAPATVAPGLGAVQPYINSLRNSRLEQDLPAGAKWTVRWRVALNPLAGANFVLAAAARIVVMAGEFRLFDRNATALASAPSGGPMMLDPSLQLFFFIKKSAYVQASHLKDGSADFIFLPTLGDTFRRTLIASKGSRVLVAAQERALDPHGRVPATRSLLEIVDIGTPHLVNRNQRLTTYRPVGQITLPSTDSLAAAGTERIVATIPASIHFLDWSADVRASYHLPGRTLALSLDEAGRAYLISEDSRLRVVSPSGELLIEHLLPAGLGTSTYPPIVSHRHEIFIAGTGKILALGPSGDVRWEQPTIGPLTGAVVTASGQLVSAEGSKLVVRDAEGKPEVLFDLGEPAATPPVMSETGDLLVASRKTLFCLRPE